MQDNFVNSADIRPLRIQPEYFPRLTQKNSLYFSRGLQLLKERRVAVISLAAGRGGRFGGYDLPQNHPERQKVLARVFDVEGRRISSLELRGSHLSWWFRNHGVTIPLYIMGNSENAEMIKAQVQRAHHFGLPFEDVHVFFENGFCRINPNQRDLMRDSKTVAEIRSEFEKEAPGVSFMEYLKDKTRQMVLENGRPGEFFRRDDGRVSLQGPGHIAAISQLILNRELLNLAKENVEFVFLANGDDVGFIIDPAKVGYLEASEGDMLVSLVPKNIIYPVIIDGEEYFVFVRDGQVKRSDLPREYAVRFSKDGKIQINKTAKDQDSKIYIGDPVLEKGGSAVELRRVLDNGMMSEFSPAVVETLATPPGFHQRRGGLFSTNQMGFKLKSILGLFGLDDLRLYEEMTQEELASRVNKVMRQVKKYVEIKDVVVSADGEEVKTRKAAQFVRLVGDLSHLLQTKFILIDRDAEEGLGGYGPLKTRADIDFAATLIAKMNGKQEVFDFRIFEQTPVSSPVVAEDTKNPGGIDFNPNNLELNVQGELVAMDAMNPSVLDNYLSIDGFIPVTINVVPAADLPILNNEVLK